MFKGRRKSKGQSTAEYILIVVLVAVLSIGIITVFGNQIRDLFRVSSQRMSGQDATLNTGLRSEADGAARRELSDLENSTP
jgi:Flp pilus assembly pilin Flp